MDSGLWTHVVLRDSPMDAVRAASLQQAIYSRTTPAPIPPLIGGAVTIILALGVCWALLIIVVLAAWHRLARHRPRTSSPHRAETTPRRRTSRHP